VLGPHGVDAVQVSPPQEHAVFDHAPWWQRYQPVSYRLESRSGDREAFVDNLWFMGRAEVRTYDLDESLGTKLRALYQRKKGRDLFDLWLCLSRGLASPERVITCFSEYMAWQELSVSRAEFESNLHEKQSTSTFLDDITPLLANEVDYDPEVAAGLVREALLARLPGEPWRGQQEP
jgi:hypothetical protein